ncbi:hypothetical protein GOV13_03035 [Candidatus Pacearchaeota archaeon]|nr:hypothetical protein [Candidatus Pacearchaeota archaeon]
MAKKLSDKDVYELLKKLWEQNIKPHMLYLILKTHADGDFHRGKHMVDQGYDLTEVYDGIEILVAKGDLSRTGKKTKITPKGRRVLKLVDAVIENASGIIVT